MPRSALVTGGSSGIGLAIARMLREEGFELTLASRSKKKVQEAAAALGAQAVAADVAVEKECERLVAGHEKRFGGLDVLVNSAGVGIGRKIERMRTSDWDQQLGVNLRGLFLVTRAALPLLKASRGLVVNVASYAGVGAAPGLAAYGASKAGVISLTRSLNAELAEDGVRATALCPGIVDTEMGAWAGLASEEMIQPDDCAQIVRVLLRLSPAARVPQIVIERAASGGA